MAQKNTKSKNFFGHIINIKRNDFLVTEGNEMKKEYFSVISKGVSYYFILTFRGRVIANHFIKKCKKAGMPINSSTLISDRYIREMFSDCITQEMYEEKMDAIIHYCAIRG